MSPKNTYKKGDILPMNILNNPDILLLTVEQVSHILQIGKSTAYELVNSPNCPFIVHHLGRTIRVDKATFIEALKKPITT